MKEPATLWRGFVYMKRSGREPIICIPLVSARLSTWLLNLNLVKRWKERGVLNKFTVVTGPTMLAVPDYVCDYYTHSCTLRFSTSIQAMSRRVHEYAQERRNGRGVRTMQLLCMRMGDVLQAMVDVKLRWLKWRSVWVYTSMPCYIS